jgi:hypothetical protein
MVVQILIWLALIVCGLFISKIVWNHKLNPLRIGVIVWTPGIILATVPREFLSPYYYHLNHIIGHKIFIALVLGYIGFMLGVIAILALFGRAIRKKRYVVGELEVNEWRLFVLYIIGLITFVFLYTQSGLLNMADLEHSEIYEGRLNLHVGSVSFLTFLMDISGIIFFTRALESGRTIYSIPYVIAIFCQMATLQKSRTVFLVLGAVFVSFLKPLQAKRLLFATKLRLVLTILAIIFCLSALFVMNGLRGIGVTQATTFGSPLFEQVYIYSGATAILNLSSSIEGYSQSDEPKNGLLLFRPITWHIVDREMLNANKYLEGINAATYLINAWADFRWLGFLVTSFMTGGVITLYILIAFKSTVHGIVFGTVAFEAVVFSVNTDVVFDPTTPIILFFALFTSVIASKNFLLSKQF